MPEDDIRCARKTQRLTLNDDSLSRRRLSRNGDVISADGHATRGGDYATDVEDDGSRPGCYGEGIAEGAFFRGVFETCDVDDFAAATATSEASVRLLLEAVLSSYKGTKI